jgi:hypothetical protein
VESLSQCEPGVAAELDAYHALFQLPTGHPPHDLHHQRRGIAEPVPTKMAVAIRLVENLPKSSLPHDRPSSLAVAIRFRRA